MRGPIAALRSPRWRRAARVRAPSARAIALYGAVAILGTALCFFLHHLGNGLPRDLARQRVAEAPAPPYGTEYEYCTFALTVLGGSDGASGGSPLLDAVLLRTWEWDETDGPCGAYDDAAAGEALPRGTLKTRYWWGGKAVYAIALRHLSVADFHRLIHVAAYAAWASFAAALWLLSRRALAVAAPLIALGVFASGIERFAGVGNGLPYVWAVSAAAILALLLRRRDSGAARAAPPFCFAAGMASSYLWLFDGHTFLAAPLIGLVAWFGYGRLPPRARARRAAGRIALYAAGFAVCFALGQAVKIAAYEASTSGFDPLGRGPGQTLLRGLDRNAGRAFSEITGDGSDSWRPCWGCAEQDWRDLSLVRDVRGYLVAIQPLGPPEARSLVAASALALAGAAAFALARARRGDAEAAWGVLWLLGMAALVLPQFLLPDDVPFRTERFVFLPLALCWSCLVLVLPGMRRRQAALLGGGVLAAALAAWGWQTVRVEATAAAFRGVRPVVSAGFEVYHSGDRLMYVRRGCGWFDAAFRQPIALAAVPLGAGDLPAADSGSIGFRFREHQLSTFRRCAAVVDLPSYPLARVVTGQWVFGEPDPIWFEGYDVNRPGADLEAYRAAYAALEGEEPAARALFDLHLGGTSLTMLRRECSPADTQARVLLHVTPVEAGDLPAARRAHGFDNLDFAFLDRGAWFDGRCMAEAELPPYAVARVRVGQRTAEGELWSTDIALAPTASGPRPATLRAARSRLAGSEPAARAAFDLYLEGRTLFYVREGCGPDDAAAPFFLHVTPLDADDLPGERRAAGFDNLDFAFHDRGWRFDGACVAAVELPDYGVARLRTGQWVRGEGEVWSAEIGLAP